MSKNHQTKFQFMIQTIIWITWHLITYNN